MATYQVSFIPFGPKSRLDIKDGENGDKEIENKEEANLNSTRVIILFYTTTDVKISKTSLKVDLNTFVSNVGGSLGLFIGFSVLGVMFFIHDLISSKI